MEYIFSKKQLEKLKKIVEETEQRLFRTTDAKATSGSQQDGWHDEIFRVLLLEEQMWNTRFNEFKVILNNARAIEPCEQKEEVRLGNEVRIQYAESGDVFEFIIDGYLVEPGENRVSLQSPMSQGLLGSKKGEKRTLSVGEKR